MNTLRNFFLISVCIIFAPVILALTLVAMFIIIPIYPVIRILQWLSNKNTQVI